MSEIPNNVKEVVLYAWVGENELGNSNEVGLKQGFVPAGLVPLVSIHGEKLTQDYLIKQLQQQSNVYGKTLRLCKFVFIEEIKTIEPSKEDKAR